MPVHPNKLLVEGRRDLWVIPELMESNGVAWPDDNRPVQIEPRGGVEELLKPAVIANEMKASGLLALGIVLDADQDAKNRWKQVVNCFQRANVAIPPNANERGWIGSGPRGIRVGIWMMPDNINPGMIETFLGKLIPDDFTELWNFAGNSTDTARKHQADFKDAHFDKAKLHAWLAWRDEPGSQLHEAVNLNRPKLLRADAPAAQPFVEWFCRMFNLSRAESP